MAFSKHAGAFAGATLLYVLTPNLRAQPSDPPVDAGVDAAPVDAAPPVEPPVAPAPPPVAVKLPTDADLEKMADSAAEVIEIDDTAPAESASSVHLDLKELQFRSRTQVSDILRQVPGLMVSQHAGGGKSDQYFIRGFDADHGTDIAIYADGVPVNMPSHGHGQGYADTHFLIPETIEVVDVHKGPYSAQYGDFATAAAMELKTLDAVDGPTLWIAGGAPLAGPKALEQYNRRIVGMASPEIRNNPDDKGLIAVEVGDTDGPFDNAQHFHQGNALAKWSGDVGKGRLTIESMWYDATWDASGQVPESVVCDGKGCPAGTISRFGSLDPSEGGDTSRTSLQARYAIRDDHGGTWRAMVYGVGYRLRLFSNFTLFARDPVHGDEIEQTDSRFYYGLDTAYDKRLDLLDMDSLITFGSQIRNDDVETGLWHDDKRVRLADCFDQGANPCNNDYDRIRDVAVYAEANIHLFPHVHVLPGIRYDMFSWDVDDLNAATRTDPALTTGGSASQQIFSPKLSVEIEATPKLNVFVNGGSGFHSNDARGDVASNGAGSLARALGTEVGIRTTYLPHTRIAADFWYLHLNSELVWNGDEGGTTPSGPTERYGADFEIAYNPAPWLRFDANVTVAHSQFVENHGNGNALALAPKLMGQGGVTFTRGTSFVSLRGRGIADRPGNDDDTLTAQGYFIFDLMMGTRITKKLGLNLTINNLLNSQWREAQFADTSAVTPTAAPVEQMHFTPGIPLTATATVSYQF